MEETIRAPYFDGSQPCAQVGGDLWFPEDYGDMKSVRSSLEKICNTCHFKKMCLQYAVTHKVDGFWAGTTPAERRQIRKTRNIEIIPYAYSRIHDVDEFY